MYTSYIGKKFLKLYNLREHSELTAQQFFESVFFPLFFQDDSHLMHVGNSPFFQKPKEDDSKLHGGKAKAQFQNMKKKIASKVYSGSILVGFAAEEMQATTSGQLTNLDFKIDEEEVYASWIGEALAIGVSGGLAMLIAEDEILWALYSGWPFYRKYLEQTPNLKDKQIETWNGNWLCHVFEKAYDKNYPFDGIISKIKPEMVVGNLAIPTQDWVKVIFALAKKYPNRILTAYCYNLSQTNTTLGFINLFLPEVAELFNLRDKIFIAEEKTILKDEQLEDLHTFYNFKNACKLGTIGLKAIEPAKLRTYMPKQSVLYAEGKDFKFTNEQSYTDYQLYKLWIIAMLNKTELLQLASDIAQALIAFEKPKQDANDRGKTSNSRLGEEVREASNMRMFIEKLTKLLHEAPDNADIFKKVVEQVLKMPSDNFPLFVTLLRFEYQYIKSKN